MSATSRTQPALQRPAAAVPARPDAAARQRRWATVVLGAGTVAAVLLHLQADFRFPVPWPDEAHFLMPAVNLARHGTLAAPQLAAPEGLFWMPDGYAVALAAVFALLPDALWVARLTSLACTLAFAGCVYAATCRLGGARLPAATAVAVWLVSPRVVMMANIARMEGLMLALTGAALLLAACRRWPGALAVASLTALVHPAGAVVFSAFAAAALLHRRHLRAVGLRPGAAEWVLLAAAVAAWVGQVARLLLHLDLVADHVGFQLQRKGDRALTPNRREVVALAAGAAGAAAARLARGRLGADRAALLTVLSLLVAGFAVVTSLGNEMWYRMLSVETALLLAAVGAAVALPVKTGAERVRGWAAGPGALAMLAATVAVTQALSVFGMRIDDGARGEWDRFLATATARLHEFDGGLAAPATVAVDRSSAIGFALADERWRHLRLLTPTPVTPLDDDEFDYVLYTLSPPPGGRGRIRDRLPTEPPALELVSEHGTFELYLYRDGS